MNDRRLRRGPCAPPAWCVRHRSVRLDLAALPAAAQSSPPPGATSCSGCHAPASVGGPVPPLAGRRPGEIQTAMREFRSGARRARSWTASRKASPTRRSTPSQRGLEHKSHESSGSTITNRRTFLKLSLAATRRSSRRPPSRKAPPERRGGRRRLRRRELRARAQAGRSRIAVTVVETDRTFTACPFSNAVIAGLREIEAQQLRLRRIARRRRCRRQATASVVDAQKRRSRSATATQPALRPAGAGARHRPPLRCPARLRRSGGRSDAARLEGGRADAPAAPPARGHGRRRPGRHLGAGQSVPLPARPLRAREPDRVLSEDARSRARS